MQTSFLPEGFIIILHGISTIVSFLLFISRKVCMKCGIILKFAKYYLLSKCSKNRILNFTQIPNLKSKHNFFDEYRFHNFVFILLKTK